MPKRKVKWNTGDVFAIELMDKSKIYGQVLDLQMTNIVRVALFNERTDFIILSELCKAENLISLLASSREQLDYGVWEIMGNKEVNIEVSRYPNEQYRDSGWVGAKHYDAAIIEEFANAYYGLIPWDDWASPNYLDNLLIDPSSKPTNLIYKAN
jgi:hypothetical protein